MGSGLAESWLRDMMIAAITRISRDLFMDAPVHTRLGNAGEGSAPSGVVGNDDQTGAQHMSILRSNRLSRDGKSSLTRTWRVR